MAETILVTTIAIGVSKFLHAHNSWNLQWVAIPGMLVVAALVPTWIQKREFPPIGFHLAHLRPIVRTVGGVCLWTFPAVFLGLWMLTLWHRPLPLRPALPDPQGWPAWLLYQFLYVAVAEEVFFRGYLQANVTRWLHRASRLPGRAQQYLAIGISAGGFALAHVVVQGQITSALTFLPGVVLAWLFLRTRVLLAPILFHGLANISYGLMALSLT